MESEALSATQQLDFSLLALFMRASLTVQIVMVMLVVASIWSWAVILDRFLRFRRALHESAMFEDAFWSGQPLEELYERIGKSPRSAMEKIFVAGMNEWRRSFSRHGLIPGAQSRIERSMNVAITRAADGLNRGLGVLATVGSTSPFIGLFGTVWGIKTAFEDIAIQQNTNLAVVAPGIAEALLATALGLLAAIPAVVFYNKYSTDADRIVAEYESFAEEFSTILSRQLQREDA